MSFAELLAYRIERRLPAMPSILLILLLALACRPVAPPPGVVAVTDLGEIQFTELEEHILALPEARRSPPADSPLPEWRRGLLEELIARRALAAEARSLGLAETPGGAELLKTRTDPVLIEVMGSRLIGEKVDVTEEDLKAFYDARPEEFSHPDQVRVRNIYLRVARDAPPEVWEARRLEIEDLLEQMRRGARFGDLAREHSDSETAPLEGLIGRLDRGKLDPSLEEILWGLDEGEVSRAIKTPNGFQIFMVENHIGQFKMDFEDARGRLLRRLTREATEAAEDAVLQDLLEASKATYEPEGLSRGLDEIVFSLEGETLTVADFHQRLDSVGFFAARDLAARRLLDRAAREQLYLWQAVQQDLAAEPEVAARLEDVEQEVLVTLARRERGGKMAGQVKEQDLRDFYASRVQRFRTPRLVRMRILSRDFPEEGSWYSVFEELEQLAEDLRTGRRDFAAAARELSTDFTAARGGDVGAIRPTAVAEWAGPQAQRAVLALAAGEVSEPILIERYNTNRLTYERAGYMLVKVEAIEESRVQPFEDVRERVIEQYLEQVDGEVGQRIRQEVLASVSAEIFAENL